MYYYFEHEHHKWKLYDVWFLRYGTQQNFSHFRPFFVLLHPLPLTTERIKILKKMKKTSGDIIILHKCTINDNHMIYGSWDINCNRQIFFVIFGHFLLFYLPNSPKNENITKLKKTPGDIIILHKCTKNHDHMLQCSWDMACDGRNCYFSFWAIFCSITPVTAQKMKISKKWKKCLVISSFYTIVPKIMIICYTASDIRCMTGVIIFHLGLFC